MLIDGNIAQNNLKVKKKSYFRGVSGTSELFKFQGMLFPMSITFDTMHSIDLGVLKMLLECWFGSRDKFKAFRIDPAQISLISLNLETLKIPDSFSRRPRSLNELGYWKADEYKNFFMYFFPVLHKSIPDAYYEHTMLFIRAYRILNCQKITIQKFLKAKELIAAFAKELPTLYGDWVFTKKMHLTVYHLMDQVEFFGPPSNYSAKRFEDLNGRLMRKNYGKFQIAEQLIQKFCIPTIIENMIEHLQIEKDSTLGTLLGQVGYQPFQKVSSKWKEVCGVQFKPMSIEKGTSFCQSFKNTQDTNFRNLDKNSLVEKVRLGTQVFKFCETNKRDSTFVLVKMGEGKFCISKIKFFSYDSSVSVGHTPLFAFHGQVFGSVSFANYAQQECKQSHVHNASNIVCEVVAFSNVSQGSMWFTPVDHDVLQDNVQTQQKFSREIPQNPAVSLQQAITWTENVVYYT